VWAREANIWRDLSASHLILRQRQGPKEQIDTLQRFKAEVGLEALA
jgi:hypothetical protein